MSSVSMWFEPLPLSHYFSRDSHAIILSDAQSIVPDRCCFEETVWSKLMYRIPRAHLDQFDHFLRWDRGTDRRICCEHYCSRCCLWSARDKDVFEEEESCHDYGNLRRCNILSRTCWHTSYSHSKGQTVLIWLNSIATINGDFKEFCIFFPLNKPIHSNGTEYLWSNRGSSRCPAQRCWPSRSCISNDRWFNDYRKWQCRNIDNGHTWTRNFGDQLNYISLIHLESNTIITVG